jgi:hypothetical protein
MLGLAVHDCDCLHGRILKMSVVNLHTVVGTYKWLKVADHIKS